MRIISDFKDYYDGPQGSDGDPTPLFLRKEQSLEARTAPYAGALWPNCEVPAINSFENIRGVIAFCGRSYVYWRIDGSYCYTLQQVVTALTRLLESRKGLAWVGYKNDVKAIQRALDIAKDESYRPTPRKSKWSPAPALCPRSWATYCEESKNYRVKDEVFIHYRSPILAIERDTLRVNPNLKSFGFHSVMDPYTAYQELSMFMDNNMAQQLDPIPKMTDELKVHAHGFNQWSFRTHKEDSPKARKKREKEAPRPLPTEEPELPLDDSDFQ